MSGLTAFHGFNLSEPKKGETIFGELRASQRAKRQRRRLLADFSFRAWSPVSAAAGAVGQIVVQLAKAVGLKVIASAGDAQKVAFLRDELKADVVFDYKEQDTASVLAEHPFEI